MNQQVLETSPVNKLVYDPSEGKDWYIIGSTCMWPQYTQVHHSCRPIIDISDLSLEKALLLEGKEILMQLFKPKGYISLGDVSRWSMMSRGLGRVLHICLDDTRFLAAHHYYTVYPDGTAEYFHECNKKPRHPVVENEQFY